MNRIKTVFAAALALVIVAVMAFLPRWTAGVSDAFASEKPGTAAMQSVELALNSDSTDDGSMIVVDTAKANGSVSVVKGISYSAVCLYTGDDIDLIPSSKKAVAVSVTGVESKAKLTYNDGTKTYEFKYSAEISEKTGVATYVALVDSSVDMAHHNLQEYFLSSNPLQT